MGIKMKKHKIIQKFLCLFSIIQRLLQRKWKKHYIFHLSVWNLFSPCIWIGTTLSPGALKCHLKPSGPSFWEKGSQSLSTLWWEGTFAHWLKFSQTCPESPSVVFLVHTLFDLGRLRSPYVSVVLYLLLVFQGLWLVYCHMPLVTHHFFLLRWSNF